MNVRTRRNRFILPAVVMVGLLIAGGCTSDDSSGDSSDNSGAAEAAVGEPTVGAPEVPAECDTGADGAAKEIQDRGKPDAAAIVADMGDGPVDVIEGDGDAVIDGGDLEIEYVIVNPADGSVVESSWETDGTQPISLAQVFPSFNDAVAGMKVGGERAFTVSVNDVFGGDPPAELGLSADDKLVFIVDVASVSEAKDPSASAVETDEDALAAAEERGAPDVVVPEEGDETTEDLIVIDDVVGDGAVVCPGDTVVAHYTGIAATDGEKFDSSWDRGEPAEFSLDGVIKGWTDGLVGMKVGGRRTLVIPADQAYGEDTSGGQPAGVLVFTIDLVGVG